MNFPPQNTAQLLKTQGRFFAFSSESTSIKSASIPFSSQNLRLDSMRPGINGHWAS